MPVPSKRLLSLALALFLVTVPRPALPTTWETILDEHFSTLDPSLWTVASNGGGSAQANAGILEIRSGPQDGGGTWVESVQSFDVSTCDYAFTIVCRPQSPVVGHNDSAHWGFSHLVPGILTRLINFHVGTCHVADGPQWYAGVQDTEPVTGHTLGMEHRQLLGGSGAGWEEMTAYRVEVVAGTATFLVDGEVVLTYGCPNLPLAPYRIRLDKTSPGQDTYLYVDRVVVERSASCVVPRETVLFSTDRGNGDGNLDVWAMKADGTFARRLTQTAGVSELWPRISPDGRWVLAVWRDPSLGTRGNGRVVRFDPEGGAYQEILSNVPHKSPLAAAWSGDGTRVIVGVHTSANDEFHQLKSFELTAGGDGVNPIDLTTGAEANSHQAGSPHVSPDGTLVAFQGGPIGDRSRVFVVDAAGGKNVSLDVASGDPLINLQFARWSPDGASLTCMAELPSGSHELRLLDYPFTGQTTYASGVGHAAPVFVTDTMVLFASSAGGDPDLWMGDTSGGPLVQLTSDNALDLTPEYGVLVTHLDQVVAAPAIGQAGTGGPRWVAVQPNPAVGGATITYDAPHRGPWNVSVFDVTGRRVRTIDVPAPKGVVQWNGVDDVGRSVAAGVYFVRLSAGEESQAARVTLLK